MDVLPEELFFDILRRVGCQDMETVRMVNQRFRRIGGDPGCCNCDVSHKIREVLLTGNRRALIHLFRSHRAVIDNRLLGELCLAAGDVKCPAVDASAHPTDEASQQNLLLLACDEGKTRLVEELLTGGAKPTTRIVHTACRRLHEIKDEGPLLALLESSAEIVDPEVSLVNDSADDTDSSDDCADEMGRILADPCLPMYLRTHRYTTAFVYLLRWDARFSSSRLNHLMALECAVHTGDRQAARELFHECGTDPRWVSRSHVALLAQNNWDHLLALVLAAQPSYAREALERAIISNSPGCVRVAAALTPMNAVRALATFNLATHERSSDDTLQSLIVASPDIRAHIAPNMMLQRAWARKWVKSLEAILYICSERDGPIPAFLENHASELIQWACRQREYQLILPLARFRRLPWDTDAVMCTARHLRKRRPLDSPIDKGIVEALSERPELFRQLTRTG